MISNLQQQYRMQLAQYEQQEQQFTDWAKRYQQYQQTYILQKQQYDEYRRRQSQLQGVQQRSLRGRGKQKSGAGALVQVSTRSNAAGATSLQAQKRALQQSARLILSQQAAL